MITMCSIFLVSEAMLSAPDFFRSHAAFANAKRVAPVRFHGDDEAAELGSSPTAVQYTSFISTDELGPDLFRSGASPNAFLTGPGRVWQIASHHECVGPNDEGKIWC